MSFYLEKIIISLEPDNLRHQTTASMAGAVHYHSHCRFLADPNVFKSSPPNPLLSLHKSRRLCLKPPSFPSSSPLTARASVTPKEGSVPTSLLEDPFLKNLFLTNQEHEKLKLLENFSYREELESGSLWVRVMRHEEMDATAKLLVDGESTLPGAYVTLLSFFSKLYLVGRRASMPHAATLVGVYRGNAEEDGGGELAGTVEVSFDKRGAKSSSPNPSQPMDKPHISNLIVKKPLRRRGIGRHLLKASEELICETTCSKEVYLHCRVIDEAPLNMYLKAGYNVLKTSSIFVLLTLQRRIHLMCKNLSTLDAPSETDISGSDYEH